MKARLQFAMVAFGIVALSATADQPPPTGAQSKPGDGAKAKGKTVEWDTPREDPAKLRERITLDMQSAESKLKENDSGNATRQVQDRILNNIDKLIELARNPPPPPSSSDSSPQGGQPQGGAQSQPSGGGATQPQGGGQSRRERREQQQGQSGQQAKGGPAQPKPGEPRPLPGRGPTASGQAPSGGRGQPERDGMPDKFADVVKDIWGHLPETLRQEVDHYYRDQFMPRYRDLLQQYYSRLAERDRKRGRDR